MSGTSLVLGGALLVLGGTSLVLGGALLVLGDVLLVLGGALLFLGGALLVLGDVLLLLGGALLELSRENAQSKVRTFWSFLEGKQCLFTYLLIHRSISSLHNRHWQPYCEPEDTTPSSQQAQVWNN